MGTGPLPVRGILWAPEVSGVGLVGTLAALVSVSFLRGKLEDFKKNDHMLKIEETASKAEVDIYILIIIIMIFT